MAFIELKQVSKSFGSVQALNQLDLDIGQGSVCALLGHNGAGKTTTLRLILGLLSPDSGELTVGGLNPVQDGDAVRRMCGVLSEDTGLYEPLSVYDNLSYFARLYGMTRGDYDARIDALLARLDILDKKNLAVRGFSTGMKKKVALIRAMLHRPRLLLLDEPTSGLDPVSIEHLRAILTELTEQDGATIVLTTHNLSEVERVADQIAILRYGRSIFTNTLEALRCETGGGDFDLERLYMKIEGQAAEHGRD
ncbi:ABC transporter ATP-binding protein [Eubacterium sp. 1001713B170207_170306_E7]|uniref:ABC transporter ATP-binding protein n=1 Tax=Eubacterium sp. 1001713B170207_170306_E7 TaxID=2787097 RepID=UPI0018994C5B|nr:ABC transporter ATP-binding protein [Eubacterium sp. 1001713B170207_170306_E7]